MVAKTKSGIASVVIVLAAVAIAAGAGSAGASASQPRVAWHTCNESTVLTTGGGVRCEVRIAYDAWLQQNCPIGTCRVEVSNRTVGTGTWTAYAQIWEEVSRSACARSSLNSTPCTHTWILKAYHIRNGVITGDCHSPSNGIALLMEVDCTLTLSMP